MKYYQTVLLVVSIVSKQNVMLFRWIAQIVQSTNWVMFTDFLILKRSNCMYNACILVNSIQQSFIIFLFKSNFGDETKLLTDGIFETGAYAVPSKSQNSTVLGQGGSSSIQCSSPSLAWRWCHRFGTNNYPPFRHSTKNHIFSPTLDF